MHRRLPFWQSESFLPFLLDRGLRLWYNIYIMTTVSYFDSSYSPNEAREASNTPNCGACYDEGMIVDQDVYCDCPEGDKAMNNDSRNELYEDTVGVNPECLEPIYDASEEGDYYDDSRYGCGYIS